MSTGTKLYLVVNCAPDVDATLGVVLQTGTIASVLIRKAPNLPAEATLDHAQAKRLVDAIQAKGIAALIEADAVLARRCKADGVHIPWGKDVTDRYKAARETLGSHAIIGADAGRSRHDAMTLGELGADYIGFGIPPHVEDRATAIARRRDLVSWWAEIFEVPCVAFDVDDADEAERLASAHADFIAVPLPPGITAQDAKAWSEVFDRAIAMAGVSA